MIDLSEYTDFPNTLLIKLLIRGTHMGEVFRLNDWAQLVLPNPTEKVSPTCGQKQDQFPKPYIL
jgi:hypothetical protein